jgi:hypothetical protein
MDFNFMIKQSITEVCNEVKKEENMNLLKQDILNPIVEHVMYQMYPYILKFVIGFVLLVVLIIFLIILNLRIIYKK